VVLGETPDVPLSRRATERLELVLRDPGYRQEAGRLGDEMAAMPPPAFVVDQLVCWLADR
jgi:hypothetical protein